jgi:hypothetical protein
MTRKMATLFALCLAAGSALAAEAPAKPLKARPPATTKVLAPVTQAEAKTFGERISGYGDRRDLRALAAYRKTDELMLLFTQGGQPGGVRLTGTRLHNFIKENLLATEEVKSGTSCMYHAREDGQALESCITVNAAQRYPIYSVSLIARDNQGLHFATTFVTDNARLAHLVSTAARQTAEDTKDEDDDEDEASDSTGQKLHVPFGGPRRGLHGA